jgi:hypothetical protein
MKSSFGREPDVLASTAAKADSDVIVVRYSYKQRNEEKIQRACQKEIENDLYFLFLWIATHGIQCT